jgi:hypothetical protein
MWGPPENLKADLADVMFGQMARWVLSDFKLCESPIEVTLGAAIFWLDRLRWGFCHGTQLYVQSPHEKIRPGSRLLIPQFPWRGRRIDFAFIDGSDTVFIECDGHDYHERTKSQAIRDRRRDREIQNDGYPVLRFTGSEIYNDPVGCADEVHTFVINLCLPNDLRRA